MKNRLYDIIDRDRDGKMTAEELQAAIGLPAHAQSLSQLIISTKANGATNPISGTRWTQYWAIAVRLRF